MRKVASIDIAVRSVREKHAGLFGQTWSNYNPNQNFLQNMGNQLKFNGVRMGLLGGLGLATWGGKKVYDSVKSMGGIGGVLNWAGKNPGNTNQVIQDVSNYVSPHLGGAMSIGNSIMQSPFGNAIGNKANQAWNSNFMQNTVIPAAQKVKNFFWGGNPAAQANTANQANQAGQQMTLPFGTP